MFKRVVSWTTLLLGLSLATLGHASAYDFAARVLPSAKAPVLLTKCVWTDGGVGIVILNRAHYGLLQFDVRIFLFDTANTIMGQYDVSRDFDRAVVPGDVNSSSTYGQGSINEPMSAFDHATCRMQGAVFAGHKHWQYGDTWHEPMLPATTSIDASGGATPLANDAAPITRSDFQLDVTKSWNDTINGVLLVHDAIVVTAADQGGTLTPSQLHLTMKLTNGGSKRYSGMSQAAPTYQKINPLGSQTTTAYEVDPSSDLGSLGSIQIAPHGTATLVVTFAIPDPVADQNDNRNVSMP